jgi:hypothetical protein
MKWISLFIFLSSIVNGISQLEAETCAIHGIIVDMNQIPIEGATVVIYHHPSPNDTALTNEQGKYCFNDYYDGLFNMYFYHREYGTKKINGFLKKAVTKLELDTVMLSDLQIAHQKLYSKLTTKADELYNNKDYEKALILYKRAFEFKPNDQENIAKMKKTEELISK